MSTENVEQLSLFENEEKEIIAPNDTLDADEKFKDAVYAQMRKIHNEGMVVGFQTACHTALNKIYAFERSTGKKSANDYKRCIKDLKQFFEIGLSRNGKPDETDKKEESAETETTQN